MTLIRLTSIRWIPTRRAEWTLAERAAIAADVPGACDWTLGAWAPRT